MNAEADGICHPRCSHLTPAPRLGLPAGWVQVPSCHPAQAQGMALQGQLEVPGDELQSWVRSETWVASSLYPVSAIACCSSVGLLLGATPPPWMLLPFATYS